MKRYEVAGDGQGKCINYEFDSYLEAYKFIHKMAKQDTTMTWTLYSHINGVEKELFSLNENKEQL